MTVATDVNRRIWRLFKDNGVTIPVAQREVVFEMRERGRPTPPPANDVIARDV